MKTPQTNNKSSRGIGIDLLWLLIILAGSLFVTSLIPLEPNDYWWHLKIGEWIHTHRAIPTSNMFAWTIPADSPYLYATWLGELIIYWLFRLGGVQLTIFTRTLLLGITFWLVGTEARRRSGSWRIAAFVVALGFVMTLSNVQVRTQIWSWLPFTIYLLLLSRFVDGKLSKGRLLILPLLMIFWVNVHGAFILGLLLIGIYFLGELLRTLLKMPSALSQKDVFWLALIGILTGASTFINPRFLGIVTYVWDLMTDQPSQELIVEWQSPTPEGLAHTTFFLSIIILIICLAYSRYRPPPTAALTMVIFIWLAWSGVRYIVWYAIAVMPILAQTISMLPVKFPSFESERNIRNVFIAILIFIPVLLVQPWFVTNFPLPDTYKQQVLYDTPAGPLLSTSTPVAAVEYLQHHPGGKLFNEMGYGSYLIWALPDQKVFADPRVELYSFEQWQDYIHINNGSSYNQILEQYGANRLLLSKSRQGELVDLLKNDPTWYKEYEDQYSQIWKKVVDEQP
jgi:NADH:ubiquinone oxidoreductase subunit 6 (subunit J)